MLQTALLLGYALSDYRYLINRVVASFTIGFTPLGFFPYLLIVAAAAPSYDCPPQAPLSIILHFLVRFESGHRKYLERSRKWLGRISSQREERPRPRYGTPYNLDGSGTIDGNSSSDRTELSMVILSNQPAPIFDKDTTMTITRFILELVWHVDLRTTLLERLYNPLLEYFDRSSGRYIVKPAFRNMTYLSAKSLLT